MNRQRAFPSTAKQATRSRVTSRRKMASQRIGTQRRHSRVAKNGTVPSTAADEHEPARLEQDGGRTENKL